MALSLALELPFALISTSSDAMTILVISVVFGFVTVLARASSSAV